MEWAILVSFIAWYLLVIALLAGWLKASPGFTTQVKRADGLRISVVVPVRNEEKNIAALLEDLLSQTILPFEIIVADDHSSDQTQLIVRQFAAKYPCVKLLSLPEKLMGKKAALQAAVTISKGEIIVTTDADCRVGKHWLESMSKIFTNVHVQLVAGPVLFGGQILAARLLNMEQLVLQSAAASSFRIGYPLFCSGANLAFRKSAFNEVNGYEGFDYLASGDDVFLMQKIGQKYPQGMAYCALPDCVVNTLPPPSFNEFINQRVRWAGKWRLLARNVKVLAVFVFLFQLLVLAIPLLAINWIITLPYLLALIGVKWILEGILVTSVARHLGASISTGSFLLAQLFYPVYVVIIGILSFRGKTLWKGRSVSTR